MAIKNKKSVQSEPERRKPKLSEIDELGMAVFICKTSKENELKDYVTELGGVVLSSMRARGLSRNAVAVAFGAYTEMNVIFVTCQQEISRQLIYDVSQKFKFSQAGNGKGFLIDVDGYMGAKAAFI